MDKTVWQRRSCVRAQKIHINIFYFYFVGGNQMSGYYIKLGKDRRTLCIYHRPRVVRRFIKNHPNLILDKRTANIYYFFSPEPLTDETFNTLVDEIKQLDKEIDKTHARKYETTIEL